jgi:hypothetical protein
LAETYGRHGRDLSQAGAGTVKGAHTDTNLQAAEADLKVFFTVLAVIGANQGPLTKFKILIERFANSTSTEDLFDSIKNIYADAERDPDLKNWFKALDLFVRKCLKEQGYILQEQSDREWNQLYEQGQFLLRERYRSHTNRVIDETKFIADQFDQDAQNKAFGLSVQKLFQDLGNDANGKPAFKPHLLTDISDVVLPAIFEHTRYVPIPRIEISDPMIDAVVENLVIESDNLAPNMLEFGSDNYFRWGRKKISNKHDNKLMISASGVQMDLRDVSYYVKKKQGFPSVTDKGLMDIFMGGEGFSFKIAASTAHKKDKQHFAKIDKVTVDIKNLKIKVKESKYKLLFTIAKPIMLKVLRPVIQKVLEKQIRDSFTQADAYLYDIHREAQKAIEAAKANPDPENVSNMYKEYVAAIRQKMTAKKEAAQKKTSDTKGMCIVVDLRASLFIVLGYGCANFLSPQSTWPSLSTTLSSKTLTFPAASPPRRPSSKPSPPRATSGSRRCSASAAARNLATCPSWRPCLASPTMRRQAVYAAQTHPLPTPKE